MFIDHIKYALPSLTNIISICIGRISFPLFAFMTVQGYLHTSNLKKYYKRLVVFALISQIPFMLFRTLVGEWKMLNSIFTLLLGVVAINSLDKIEKKYLSIPLCIVLVLFGELLRTDYGGYGVLMIIIFYIFRNKKIHLYLVYFLITTIYLKLRGLIIFKDILYYLSYFIPLAIIYFYNGKKGKEQGYFFYIFYPVHMLFVYLISL